VEACRGPDGRTGPATILVVDDEDIVRRCVRLTLEGAGYAVMEATSGVQALELLAVPGSAVRLVLSDCAMPDMDGWDLLRTIGATRPALPLILMTGWAAAFAEGLDANPAVVLEKPSPRRCCWRMSDECSRTTIGVEHESSVI
jgi:two-component system cell cycle sensor histidine kinase/response regulator CckA